MTDIPSSADAEREAMERDYEVQNWTVLALAAKGEEEAIGAIKRCWKYIQSLTARAERAERLTEEVRALSLERLAENARLRAENEGLREALEPFASFIENTDPAWDNRRRIATLNYDFDKLTLGLFRKARAALSSQQAAAEDGERGC